MTDALIGSCASTCTCTFGISPASQPAGRTDGRSAKLRSDAMQPYARNPCSADTYIQQLPSLTMPTPGLPAQQRTVVCRLTRALIGPPQRPRGSLHGLLMSIAFFSFPFLSCRSVRRWSVQDAIALRWLRAKGPISPCFGSERGPTSTQERPGREEQRGGDRVPTVAEERFASARQVPTHGGLALGCPHAYVDGWSPSRTVSLSSSSSNGCLRQSGATG